MFPGRRVRSAGFQRSVEHRLFGRGSIRSGNLGRGINDPVVVFLKDRFLPFWRFAFTGFINVVDDADSVTNQMINLTCEDVTKFVRMKEYNINPGLIEVGKLRTSLIVIFCQ